MEARQTPSGFTVVNVEPAPTMTRISVDGYHHVHKAIATFASSYHPAVALPIHCGPSSFSHAEFYIETPYHRAILSSLVLVPAGN
ncbi:hypothetical protein G6F57_023628 [Rhizopus arrhizus]|nr:hypothetical protein G6F57_023628 [Rhizopus arrhizus]